MADSVAPTRLPPPNGAGQTPPPRGPRYTPPNRSYTGRFAIGYVVLALLLAAAGVGAYLVFRGDNGKQATAQPSGSFRYTPSQGGELGAVAIARNVQQRYRTDDGQHEIVAVVASRPQVSRRPIQTILVEPADAQEAKNISKPDTPKTPFYTKDILGIPMQNGMSFELCGLGDSCSISTGKPSTQRLRFVQLEAMELAIRTFKSDADVKNVVVYLPPAAPPKPPASQIPVKQLSATLATVRQQLGNANTIASGLLTLLFQAQQVLIDQLSQQNQAAAQAGASTTQLAMYFRRSDMGSMLSQPLEKSVPLTKDRVTQKDLSVLDSTELDDRVRPFLYQSDIQVGGDGNPLLILQPVQP
jgi:hypothetical protein